MQRANRPSNETSTRFSIIIPTFQRRAIVLKSVAALTHQEFDGSFEVIVVVDGSDDGSGEALSGLDTPFPLTVVEQPNQGAATARNHGAAVARGEILLFLDDDMEAHPQMLAEHDRSHGEGADAVLGHLPLHPESPPSFLSAGVKSWADERIQRLTAPDAGLTLHDLLTGQLSISRELFHSVGGFDTSFTFGGSFGNEDVDFGYRLLLKGYQIVFNPNAISWQYYAVQPRQYLRQLHQAGHADAKLARKYPEQAQTLFEFNNSERRLNRFFWRPLQRFPLLASLLMKSLTWFTLILLDRGLENVITVRLFRETVSAVYRRGVDEAGGMPKSGSLRVLAYHAISNRPEGSVIEAYSVPPNLFKCQLDGLLQSGFQFINIDEFLRFLHGQGGVPRRALLLTFDDCYTDLVDVVLPILVERSIPAAAFAVSGLLGGTNEWDKVIGAPQLRLLDADGLRKLAEYGLEIGSHSRTHQLLTRVSDEELGEEIKGSIIDLETCGLARPRLFAYPYGESNHKVQHAAQAAGLLAAFTVKPGRVRSGQDPFQIPRIEILRGDVGWKLRLKLEAAGPLLVAVKKFSSLLDKFTKVANISCLAFLLGYA